MLSLPPTMLKPRPWGKSGRQRVLGSHSLGSPKEGRDGRGRAMSSGQELWTPNGRPGTPRPTGCGPCRLCCSAHGGPAQTPRLRPHLPLLQSGARSPLTGSVSIVTRRLTTTRAPPPAAGTLAASLGEPTPWSRPPLRPEPPPAPAPRPSLDKATRWPHSHGSPCVWPGLVPGPCQVDGRPPCL